MNDEDLARQAFENAFAGEPATLPNLDRIAARGRQAQRTHAAAYTAGGVALAGVVTAGAVVAPALVGSTGSSSGPTISAASDGPGSTALGWTNISGPACGSADAAKAQSVVDAVSGKLSSWGIHSTTAAVKCASLPDGAIGVQATIDLSGGDTAVDVTVRTDQPAPAGSGWLTAEQLAAQARGKAEQEQRALQAAAAAAAAAAADAAGEGEAATGAGSGNPASVAASPPLVPGATPVEITPMPCVTGEGGASLCYSDLASGGWARNSVLLLRAGAHPLTVVVDSAEGTLAGPEPSPTPPLTHDQLAEITNAIAALF